MYKLSNEIIHLSLEKDTLNTPTKDIYYLFQDGKIINQGNFNKLKLIFDSIIKRNKNIIEEATKKFRDKPIDRKLLFNNFMDIVGTEGYLERKDKKK